MHPLIQALLDPRCYPHPVEAVRLLETHISWVLLTGAYAYKIKKPVRLDFLDFSTLELRRHYCAEELRLNRRFAPQIYLEVVAITGDPSNPRIGGTGTALEYALKMREFPQECLLERRLEAGLVSTADIDALAAACARIHAAAASASAKAAFGEPSTLLAPALDNFATIDRLLARAQRRADIAPLRVWTENEHARLTEAFAERKMSGRIRECHGDLHLRNIAQIDGEPVLFDCVEFDERLRWIDVIDEMAFLVMDLHARGRADLARRLLNRYLEASGDYDGVRVLRFYLVYRAAVRAKVDCIRATQRDTAARVNDGAAAKAKDGAAAKAKDGAAAKAKDGAAAKAKDGAAAPWADFERRIDLARHFARAAPTFIAITCGVSGSGKTYVTDRVLERIPAIRVRTDVERKRLAGLEPLARSGSGVDADLYAAQASDRTYARLETLARAIVESGYPAIVDGTFIDRERRRAFRALAAALGVRFFILHCRAPQEVLVQRIERRLESGADASEAGLEVLQAQQRREQAVESAECTELIEVDSDDPASVDAMVERLARIDESG